MHLTLYISCDVLTFYYKISKEMAQNNTKPDKSNDKIIDADRAEENETVKNKPAAPKSPSTCKGSLSDNNIKKIDKEGKDKNVVSVKSWNCREMHSESSQLPSNVEKDLAIGLERISIAENQEDFVSNSNLLRARDSLEDLLKNDETTSRMNSKSNTSRSTKEKIPPEQNKSSPTLGESKKPSSVAKVLAWDPFEKVGRKCKDNKRKKFNKKLDLPRTSKNQNQLEPAIKNHNIDHKTGDEVAEKRNSTNNNSDNNNDSNEENGNNYECVYDFKFHPKNTKSVVFTNEVMVVYFNGENVVSEAKEPLKRELEQQVRNKEMRRGHLLKAQETFNNMCLF